MDFKRTVKGRMVKEFKTSFKSSLKDITYNRDLEGYTDNPNNDPDLEPYYDNINEVWVYPTGTSPDNTETTFKALKRDAVKDAGKDPDLFVTDLKFTIFYDDFHSVFTTPPYTSDTITFNNVDYRIVKADSDSVDCFYHLFVRGI